MSVDLGRVLQAHVDAGALAGAAAAVVTPAGVSAGAAGARAEGAPMAPDTVVWIASMTKAVTAVAALALVEAGRLELDAPVAALLPYFAEVEVLDGFTPSGEPILRAPKRPVTLRHLLAHTSGLGYDWADATLDRYLQVTGAPRVTTGLRVSYEQPLLFDPGEGWAYGIGIDWVGQLIEAVTGDRADDHVTAAVLEPLQMADTTFRRSDAQRARAATIHRREAAGLAPVAFTLDEDPEVVLAGGGLHSTVVDFLRFARMILGGGELDGVRIVSPETVRLMGENQLAPGRSARGWRTNSPSFSNDVPLDAAMAQHWGLSFLLNTERTPEGRAPGSLAWAGLANSYFWIDPTRQVAGVFATQLFPFYDGPSLEAFRDVERATYASLGP